MIFLTGAFFWGILVSAVARTQLFAFQLGLVTTFLPSFLLSGFLYAIENMPVPIQVITHVVPARYFVTIVRGIFLKGIGLRHVVGAGAVSGRLLRAGVLGGRAQDEAEAGIRIIAMIERIFAIIRKELSQMFRNRRTRMFLFVPPMFQLIIFGYAVNLDVDNLRMAWMDMDQSPQSHDLLAAFQGSGRFLLTALPQSEKDIQDVLDRGEAQVVVRVLPGFGRDILLGRPDRGADPGGRHQFEYRLAGFGLHQPAGGRLFRQAGSRTDAVAHDGPRGHGHHEPESRRASPTARGCGSIPI